MITRKHPEQCTREGKMGELCMKVRVKRTAVINKHASLESQWECVSGNIIQQFYDFTVLVQNHPLVQTECTQNIRKRDSRGPDGECAVSSSVHVGDVMTGGTTYLHLETNPVHTDTHAETSTDRERPTNSEGFGTMGVILSTFPQLLIKRTRRCEGQEPEQSLGLDGLRLGQKAVDVQNDWGGDVTDGKEAEHLAFARWDWSEEAVVSFDINLPFCRSGICSDTVGGITARMSSESGFVPDVSEIAVGYMFQVFGLSVFAEARPVMTHSTEPGSSGNPSTILHQHQDSRHMASLTLKGTGYPESLSVFQDLVLKQV
ncbi:hypothetical protein IRJ41_003663 [Triplophysa rosa]|uniref:Uncharacterized protein n=1 Tax=Triplophysa rosa TaxID=992332 RepID=A0A9W7WKD9_TRIRA|nr:hypothetical protein IRJ41_003663 [Triplophysa rosa]